MHRSSKGTEAGKATTTNDGTAEAEEEEEEEGEGEEDDTAKPETVKPSGSGISKLLKRGLVARGASRGKSGGDKGKKNA